MLTTSDYSVRDQYEISNEEYERLRQAHGTLDSAETHERIARRKAARQQRDGLVPRCPKCSLQMVSRDGPRGKFGAASLIRGATARALGTTICNRASRSLNASYRRLAADGPLRPSAREDALGAAICGGSDSESRATVVRRSMVLHRRI